MNLASLCHVFVACIVADVVGSVIIDTTKPTTKEHSPDCLVDTHDAGVLLFFAFCTYVLVKWPSRGTHTLFYTRVEDDAVTNKRRAISNIEDTSAVKSKLKVDVHHGAVGVTNPIPTEHDAPEDSPRWRLERSISLGDGTAVPEIKSTHKRKALSDKFKAPKSIDEGTAQDFARHCTKMPFKLRGTFAQSYPCRKWNADYIKEVVGDRIVHALSAVDGVFRLAPGRLGHVYIRFCDFIDYTTNAAAAITGLRLYLLQQSPADYPELGGDDLQQPPPLDGIEGRRVVKSAMWIAGAGSVTPLHFDISPAGDNLHIVLCGRKRFTLFDPTTDMHPNKVFGGTGPVHASRVDLADPDVSLFSNLPHAQPYVVDLVAGDAIYVPDRWWHQVETLEFSVSVNYWFWSAHWWRAFHSLVLQITSRLYTKFTWSFNKSWRVGELAKIVHRRFEPITLWGSKVLSTSI